MAPRQRSVSTDFLSRARHQLEAHGRVALGGMNSVGAASRARGGGGLSVLTNAGGEGGESSGAAQLLVLSATGDSIASGGDHVAFDTIVAQHGFDGVVPPSGGYWVHPVSGVYFLAYEHEWDTHTGGGTIRFELDGELIAGGEILSGSLGRKGHGTIAYFADAGSVGRIHVAQASGSDQTCDATLTVAISDPDVADKWTQVFDGDIYDLAFDGTLWWATTGSGGTIRSYDTDWELQNEYTLSNVGKLRGITFDGTDLWVTGEDDPATDEIFVRVNTSGVEQARLTVTDVSASGASLRDFGIGWDGADLWATSDPGQTGDYKLERWSTAGSLQETVDTDDTQRAGIDLHGGDFYIANGSTIDIINAAGSTTGSIDVSGATSAATGVWITDASKLYIAADGVGVWRRTRKVE